MRLQDCRYFAYTAHLSIREVSMTALTCRLASLLVVEISGEPLSSFWNQGQSQGKSVRTMELVFGDVSRYRKIAPQFWTICVLCRYEKTTDNFIMSTHTKGVPGNSGFYLNVNARCAGLTTVIQHFVLNDIFCRLYNCIFNFLVGPTCNSTRFCQDGL